MKKYLILLLFMGLSTTAWPQILFQKSVNIEVAPSFWYHPMKMSDTKVLGFNEAQLTGFTGEVFFQRINKWDDLDHFIRYPLENVALQSHMLYFQKVDTINRVKVTAEVEFENPIIGFVADGYLFNKEQQALFAPAPTHTQPAAKPNVWSLEEKSSWSPLDKVTLLSPTRIRLEFTNQSATDAIRVITISNHK